MPFRTRHIRSTYAKRVDLNIQPLQIVGRWNRLNKSVSQSACRGSRYWAIKPPGAPTNVVPMVEAA